jgi:hypothetical protein
VKNAFTILTSALAGLFFGLWISERQRRIELVDQSASSPLSIVREPRQDRTPEDISPTYKGRRELIGEYDEDEIAPYLDTLMKELIQPDMSPLEAERVANAISDISRSAINYDFSRERIKRKAREARADEWLDNLNTDGEDSHE